MVRDKFGVVYARVVCELQGACCYDLEQNPPAKKSLAVSRMFGRPVESLEQLKEAAANYAARAGEKLREENFAASLLTVYVITSMFIKNAYYNSQTVEFQTPTTNTTELISSAQLCVEKLYRKGCKFKKCGIVLNGLVQQDNIQQNLFDTRDRQKTKRLMEVIDKINSSTAPGIFWAAEGIRQPWRVKFKKRSKHYTTDWNHLPEAV
ncbi:MAG: DNA polymerase V subunit UmuC [Planctomycetes bacterium ADurb.Bin401]|nr:MAG: DNA polymerase V subunit UmuC [Planctomycetes bacterium ADurb.Bin401]